MRRKLPLLIVISLFMSEIILNLNELLGFIFYFLLVSGVLIILSRLKILDDFSKLSIVLMIFPVLRILELFIELEFFWKILLESYLFAFLVIFYSLKFKIDPGYNSKGIWFSPLVLVLSVSFGALGNQLFDSSIGLKFLAVLPIIVFSEELLFRGMLQNLFEKEYGIYGLIFPSLLYFAFSLSFGIPIAIFLFFMSLILGGIYSFTKNIYLAFLFSLVVHFFLFIL